MTPQPREWVYLPRPADLRAIFDGLRAMACQSIVGVSNLGKSATLRSLAEPEVQAEYLGAGAADYLFIYIDFNQMLVMSDQAFYELVLRACIDALRERKINGGVLQQVQTAYRSLVAPSSAFEVPLSFAQAMATIGDQLPERVVFLFDELDGPVEGIDGRVFLNLRALKDRHESGITYVTATNRHMTQIRSDVDVAEFAELFEHNTLYISMLAEAEVRRFAERFASEEGVTFSEDNLAFIRAWGGGHPALLETTCRILGLLTGKPLRDPSQDVIIHRRASEVLTQDLNILAECRKIWNDLTDFEHDALLAISRGDGIEHASGIESVTRKHLVVKNGTDLRIFARAFSEFVQRQHAARRRPQQGLRVDLDSGEVWLNGNGVPTLTNLEYRLLLLLYGRMGKIVNKYEVVEAVWGEEYIEEVDDARIEKLVSRLRQKIEPDAQNPKFLQTVRGRGYKLSDA
jgi:hypothetical protein